MYKYCIVPKCTNTTFKTPGKLFFYVPRNPKLRKIWYAAVKRHDKTPPSYKTTRHCCEDHFDVENDMKSYIKYKLVGGKLELKKGVLPHKFDCQKPKKTKIDKPVLKKEKKRRQRKKILKELSADIEHVEPLLHSIDVIECQNEESNNIQNSDPLSIPEEIDVLSIDDDTEQETKSVQETSEGGSECNQEFDIPEGKELIVRVYNYLQTEYEQLQQLIGHSCDLSFLADILKRTVKATGVSEHTITSLLEHDQPSDEETSDDDGTAKRLRLDIDLDEDLDQKDHLGQEIFESEITQEHDVLKENDSYNTTETITIKYEQEDYDEQMEDIHLQQTHQEQTSEKQTPQAHTHQKQNMRIEEQKQYGVRIKQEIDDEMSRPSGHILATSETVKVKIEPGYCETMLSVKREPPDQQSSDVDPLSKGSS